MPNFEKFDGVKWCCNLPIWMGVSIATQRAKERENRTPDVEVMAEMVKLGTLKLGGAVVPLVSGFFADRIGARFWGGNG